MYTTLFFLTVYCFVTAHSAFEIPVINLRSWRFNSATIKYIKKYHTIQVYKSRMTKTLYEAISEDGKKKILQPIYPSEWIDISRVADSQIKLLTAVKGHANIIDLECIIKYGDCWLLVFPKYDGDLYKLSKHPLPELEIQRIMTHVFQGLLKMHEVGYAHRDIKLENIFYTVKKVKNKLFRTYKIGDLELATTQRKSDLFAGTRGIMSPEVYKRFYDPKKNDVWLMGMLLLDLLAPGYEMTGYYNPKAHYERFRSEFGFSDHVIQFLAKAFRPEISRPALKDFFAAFQELPYLRTKSQLKRSMSSNDILDRGSPIHKVRERISLVIK